MNLGDNLYALRKAKNLTQDEVAEKLNVTRQTVSKWETNLSTPDFDKIVPLCALYEISPNELLTGEKEEMQENASSTEEVKSQLFIPKKKERENYENMTRNQIKQKSAEIVSSSILIFFAAIAFVIVGLDAWGWNEEVVFCIFLLLVGWAVTRIIKHYMSVPKFEKTKKEEKQDKIVKQVTDIIGGIGLVIYFLVSFLTMAWHITWIIFIIIGMANQVVKLIFLLREEEEDEK